MTTSTYNAGGQLIGTDALGTLTTFTYDASGNLAAEVTSAGTRSYTWDYDDRLTDIEYPDSSESSYSYNAYGQRLTKVEGGTTTRFVYDGAKVVLEREGDDETQVRYTHEGGSLYSDLLSQRRDGASYDYLLDGLASVKQVVDSSQAVENSYCYEAFGQVTVGQSDVANPYLFVGGYGVQWESTPSLYFMQARYYGPSVGRFISEDPYGGSPQDPVSLHRYLYCANGPVSSSDPAGLFRLNLRFWDLGGPDSSWYWFWRAETWREAYGCRRRVEPPAPAGDASGRATHQSVGLAVPRSRIGL